MAKFNWLIATLVVLITTLWLAAEPALFSSTDFYQWRAALVQYSGMLTVGLMSLCLLLALRLPFIEQLTQGLDRSYRIHKYLGIAAVTLGSVHWLLAIIPKQLVKAGLLDPPIKGIGPRNPDSFYALIKPLRPLAEQVGEYTFYAFVVLAAIALLGMVRYKSFRYSHKLMAVAYLAIAFHSSILIKHSYWPYSITLVSLMLIWLGVVAALYSLFGRIGKSKQHKAEVAKFSYLEKSQLLDLRIKVPHWPGHHSGQFAFLRFAGEEPHPFTIASAPSTQPLRFLIKELGDFTGQLKARLVQGQALSIEGPYGNFNFSEKSPQLWLAAGAGIAAFTAILQQRANTANPPPACLYFCCEGADANFVKQLQVQAHNAQVDFKLIDNTVQDCLSFSQLQQEVPDLFSREIYFCGPVPFGKSIQQHLQQNDYDLRHFHRELFNFR
ncbi:ferredoxin reductase family protein [Agarivorans sp.]|uniref:ferredoxin reductase family protein n=1 Tax=Agarivorans sp. TaxID=1872412 RepID=UPI003D0876BA